MGTNRKVIGMESLVMRMALRSDECGAKRCSSQVRPWRGILLRKKEPTVCDPENVVCCIHPNNALDFSSFLPE